MDLGSSGEDDRDHRARIDHGTPFADATTHIESYSSYCGLASYSSAMRFYTVAVFSLSACLARRRHRLAWERNRSALDKSCDSAENGPSAPGSAVRDGDPFDGSPSSWRGRACTHQFVVRRRS